MNRVPQLITTILVLAILPAAVYSYLWLLSFVFDKFYDLLPLYFLSIAVIAFLGIIIAAFFTGIVGGTRSRALFRVLKWYSILLFSVYCASYLYAYVVLGNSNITGYWTHLVFSLGAFLTFFYCTIRITFAED